MSRHALTAWRLFVLTQISVSQNGADGRRATWTGSLDGRVSGGERVKRLYRSRSLETTAKVIAASDLSGEARHKH